MQKSRLHLLATLVHRPMFSNITTFGCYTIIKAKIRPEESSLRMCNESKTFGGMV